MVGTVFIHAPESDTIYRYASVSWFISTFCLVLPLMISLMDQCYDTMTEIYMLHSVTN
jgi:hypothetical protein